VERVGRYLPHLMRKGGQTASWLHVVESAQTSTSSVALTANTSINSAPFTVTEVQNYLVSGKNELLLTNAHGSLSEYYSITFTSHMGVPIKF